MRAEFLVAADEKVAAQRLENGDNRGDPRARARAREAHTR